MGRPVRIAHIGPAALPVGYAFGAAVERRMIDLAVAQQERGDDVLVISAALRTAEPRPPGPARELRVIDIACRLEQPLGDMELALRARAPLFVFDADVIHVHNSFTAAVCLAGVGGAKVLSFDHFMFRGSERPLVKAVYRRALRSFDLLMPTSEFSARAAAEYWSMPLTHYRVLHSGVNVERFYCDDTGGRRTPDGQLVIGYLGPLDDQAEAEILRGALQLVKTMHPQATLVVADPTVGVDVWDMVRSFDVCVIANRQEREIAAAQLLSAGTSVVCCDRGSLRGGSPGDAAALAEELIALCDERSCLARVAAAPAEARPFTWDAVAEQADGFYRELLS
ncbi:hypothetical protein BVC93_09090 [Mycobacterium sp. MS1601]|nr:hypothetical protein BVC93_09090 [Mycobacterium sp. MS1601]